MRQIDRNRIEVHLKDIACKWKIQIFHIVTLNIFQQDMMDSCGWKIQTFYTLI